MDLFGFKKRAADSEQREKKLAKLCALVDANYAFAASALRRLPPKERKHAIAHLKHIVGNMGDLRERETETYLTIDTNKSSVMNLAELCRRI